MHLFDPVDNFDAYDLVCGHRVDAMLLQTSVAAADYGSHPPLRRMPAYHLPHHHSNFAGLRAADRAVQVVGLHTVHQDAEFDRLRDMWKTLRHDDLTLLVQD